ncbi:MAG TPA: cupredoxin domain-containing protein [Stellaceae bacterium]|nr:cupredoxin domain-containing protein [Stellaceae bacterium]
MGGRTERLARAAVILIALGIPAVAAADGPSARKVTVVASEYRFSPAELSFKRGVAYRLHIENHGKEQHEFTAPEFFKTVRLRNPEALNADRTEAEIPPGTAKDLFFVPRQPGRYPLRCSDHDWAGMTGAITVK